MPKMNSIYIKLIIHFSIKNEGSEKCVRHKINVIDLELPFLRQDHAGC